jgi:hypothetical protein
MRASGAPRKTLGLCAYSLLEVPLPFWRQAAVNEPVEAPSASNGKRPAGFSSARMSGLELAFGW